MSGPATDVYEIVLLETSTPTKWFRSLLDLIMGLLSMGDARVDPGGMILTVVRKDTGEELFRHVEDMGDDGHLLHGIERDLATMTADEFAATWG